MAGSGTLARRSASGEDPFPTQRFGALLRRLPAYGRLAWHVGRDPALGTPRRAALLGAMAYLASPIDLVPGFIPVAGQLDDAAVALLGLRFALQGLPAPQRAAHLSASGLAAADLDHDLTTVRLGAGWMVRHGAAVAQVTAREAARAAVRGTQMALAGGRVLVTHSRSRLRPP